MLAASKSIFASCLFLIYPYLVYKGIELGFVWVAPVIFSAIFLLQAIASPNLKIKILKACIAIAMLLGAFYLQTLTAKILPVLIQLMLMFVFGRTLMTEKGPPFIESFVRLDYPMFPPGIKVYCRQLTLVWTGFFAFNALVCVFLAVWESDFWWALYNGVFIYLMIGALMSGEYIYRHYRFPEINIPDPLSTIKSMVSNGRKILLDMQSR